MAVENQAAINYSLLETKCLSFNLTDYGTSNKAVISFEDFEFEFSFNINLEESDKIFRVTVTVKVFGNDNNKIKHQICDLISLTSFSIVNFDQIQWRKNQEGKLFIPNPLILNCVAIAVGSVRGMLAVKLENSIYNNAVVPLVDSSLLIPPPQPPQ